MGGVFMVLLSFFNLKGNWVYFFSFVLTLIRMCFGSYFFRHQIQRRKGSVKALGLSLPAESEAYDLLVSEKNEEYW